MANRKRVTISPRTEIWNIENDNRGPSRIRTKRVFRTKVTVRDSLGRFAGGTEDVYSR
jgi:hypothetical protein